MNIEELKEYEAVCDVDYIDGEENQQKAYTLAKKKISRDWIIVTAYDVYTHRFLQQGLSEDTSIKFDNIILEVEA